MAERFDVTKDHNLFSGADAVLEITTATDFTGYALEWALYRLPLTRDSVPLLTKTTVAGVAIASPTLVRVTLDAADTEDLVGSDTARYWHELWRTDAGSKQPLAFGSFVLRQSGRA